MVMMGCGICFSKLGLLSKEERYSIGIRGIENLHRVGGSLKRHRRAQKQLWQGATVEAIAEFIGVRAQGSKNFQNYLRKHQSRIPDYQNYLYSGY
jgi:hypothetical protein